MAKNNGNIDETGCFIVLAVIGVIALMVFWGFKETLILAGVILVIYLISRYVESNQQEKQNKINAQRRAFQQREEDDNLFLKDNLQSIDRLLKDSLYQLSIIEGEGTKNETIPILITYNSHELANAKTNQARDELDKLEDILKSCILISHSKEWSLNSGNPGFILKNTAEGFKFRMSSFGVQLDKFEKQQYLEISNSPMESVYSSYMYKRELSIWENQKERREKINRSINEALSLAKREINIKRDLILKKYAKIEAEWDTLKLNYDKGNKESIIGYCANVIENIKINSSFPTNIEVEYIEDTKILIVEYQLPSIENLPKLKEVKFIKTTTQLKEFYISEKQKCQLFDSTIYKITLRLVYELFYHDGISAIDSIIFNGWVDSLNKATGVRAKSCIVTIHVKKDEFIGINLPNVDPKSCFKNLKGIACSELSSITPIKPILQINKDDKRFIESRNVELNSYTNIAAMGWEDFEHLIRELFEEVFKSLGGEVKVTQASRDGGVDAIIYDPDPIRGGKIVIQAKRYTNTVGVSAVRDLYGTVIKEGAIKGILVTTADYGPDSYDFANDKPLTLLNGSHLLNLLEEHGHKARIDIKEARRLFNVSK